jgi:polyphenol oxidase
MTSQTETNASIVWARRLTGQPGIAAGFTTRHGGFSEAPFTSFNLGSTAGDDQERVTANRRRLAEVAGFAPDRIAIAGQVHGVDVLEVSEPGLYRGCDGLVTSEPDLLLCITAADCAAVLLADAEAGVIGACHAGWRGAVGRIAVNTVEHMVALGARTEHISAFVSPCISRVHFEVGPEVAERFDARFVHWNEGVENPRVDLKSAVAAQLFEAGVPEDAVEVSDRCTFAEVSDFFSYRVEGPRSGRMMGFIGIKQAR